MKITNALEYQYLNAFIFYSNFKFNIEMQSKWKEFIRRLKLTELEFSEVLRMMNGFL